jgi:transcriptional regulator with XRE-family HTH domain
MNLEEMGNRIKKYRSRLGFTQQDLASALQVSPQAVSKWERGENAPDIAILPALSEVLGASVDSLLGADYRGNRTMEATVLFADMEGFSKLARESSPADLAIELNSFFYSITERMLAFDGIPIKYLGDELLCLFTGEDHRMRAFRASFAAKAGFLRPMRIGISSGQVWMGPLGHPLHSSPDVLGDTVNFASILNQWMKDKAPSGIVASEWSVAPVQESLKLGRKEEFSHPSVVRPFTIHEILGLA